MTKPEVTVEQLIEFLKTQDQKAIVQIIEHSSGTGYYDQGGSASEEDIDLEKHISYTDFKGNSFVKPEDSFFNKAYLLLGTYRG